MLQEWKNESIVEKSFVFSDLFWRRVSDLLEATVRGWKQQVVVNDAEKKTMRVDPRLNEKYFCNS